MLTIEEFCERFLEDSASAQQNLQTTIEVSQMAARMRRPELNYVYYVMAYESFSQQQQPKTYREHTSHLKRFIMSHTRINHEMLRAVQEQKGGPGHDPYANKRRSQ